MKPQNILVLLLALLVSTGSLFAEGNKDNTEAASQDGPVSLTMINHVDLSSPEGKTWNAIEKAYLAAHPDVELEVENLYGEAYHQKLAARAAAGDLPDVMYLWPGARSGNLFENELIEDLTPYLSEDVKAMFPESALQPQLLGGFWELPFTITATSVVYTNKAVLAEAGLEMPVTYEDLVAMVEPLQAINKDVIIMPNQSGWVMNSCLFGTIVGRLGGPTWIRDAVDGKHKFTDQVFVDSLNFLKSMYDDGVLPISSLQLAYGQNPSDFATEKAPFMIDGDWRVGAIMPIFSAEQLKDDIDLGIFPEIPGEKFPKVTSMVAGCGLGMKAGLEGRVKEEAIKFIIFFASEEAARIRLFAESIIPAYKLDLEMYSATLQPITTKRAAIYTMYPPADVVDNWVPAEANDVLNGGMQEIGLGKITPEEVAAKVEAAMER